MEGELLEAGKNPAAFMAAEKYISQKNSDIQSGCHIPGPSSISQRRGHCRS